MERHAAELFPLLQNKGLYTFIPEDPPESVEALVRRYKFLEARKSPDGSEHWLNWVMRVHSGEAVGTLQATVEAGGEAFVAYMVFPEHWKKGYAKAGLGLMIGILEQDYGVSVVKALVDTRNEASIRLLEGLAFERVGFRKDADFFKGSASDEYEYRLVIAAG